MKEELRFWKRLLIFLLVYLLVCLYGTLRSQQHIWADSSDIPQDVFIGFWYPGAPAPTSPTVYYDPHIYGDFLPSSNIDMTLGFAALTETSYIPDSGQAVFVFHDNVLCGYGEWEAINSITGETVCVFPVRGLGMSGISYYPDEGDSLTYYTQIEDTLVENLFISGGFLGGYYAEPDIYFSNYISAIDSVLWNAPQKIELREGWNLFSTYMKDTLSIEDTFYGMDVILIKDENGNPYWPAFNFNFIGGLVPKEGYQIKMGTTDTLEVLNYVLTDMSMELDSGWNIMGVPIRFEVPVASLFNASNILIIKNEWGLFYWPEYGINHLGNLIPGEGYWIKTYNTITIIYYEYN